MSMHHPEAQPKSSGARGDEELESLAQVLRRSELFLGLNDAELSRIVELPSCRRCDYQAQDIIFEQGEEAKHLYVLIEGRVQILLRASPRLPPTVQHMVINLVTKGDFFGWSALVPPHTYTLAAICVEPSSVVALAGAELNALFDRDHHVGYKVMKAFAHIVGARLRDLQQAIWGRRRSPIFED